MVIMPRVASSDRSNIRNVTTAGLISAIRPISRTIVSGSKFTVAPQSSKKFYRHFADFQFRVPTLAVGVGQRQQLLVVSFDIAHVLLAEI